MEINRTISLIKIERKAMGLAASQARLLTITSRKSSAQFESMRLSHQKLALSRNLADVSNEYQNSLKQTRLYYDFYGNGSTDNLMSYGLFMTPSFINDYTPILVTNQQNRVVLSTVFAEAARAAGIPQEGLNGYVDQETRNKFIKMLTGFGEIDEATSAAIQNTIYNPNVGLGYSTDVYYEYTTEDHDTFMRRLMNVNLADYQGLSAIDLNNCASNTSSGIMASVLTTAVSAEAQTVLDNQIERLADTQSFNYCKDGGESFGTSSKTWNSLTLNDILYGEDDIILTQNVQIGVDITDALNVHQYDDMLNVVNSVIGLLADRIQETYGLDTDVAMALQNADRQMSANCWNVSNPTLLAVTTDGYADYRTDVDCEGSNNVFSAPEGHVIASIGRANEGLHPEYIYRNYDSDNLNVHLPYYSEWDANAWHQTFHAQLAGFEFFRTAEDSPNGPAGSSYGYEPASYWVSLPSTVAAGLNMQYLDIYHWSTNTRNGELIQDTEHDYSSDDNDDSYYGVDGHPLATDDDDNDPIKHAEGNGVNKARRNAMVNSIDGAKYNLALFNLYDYTGNYSTADPERNNNKNYGGNYGSINLSAFVKAWYTYFVQSLATSQLADAEGTDADNLDALHYASINFHQKSDNTTFVTDASMVDKLDSLEFNRVTAVVDDGINNIATFYDTIINQICEYGWTENNEVKEDPMYLQEMIKSGKMFLFKMANDNFYYQKNYSTDTFIKEIEDETAIAQAEAKYKTQKSRINAKEQEIDIKMKNLDTEISSLETEYEAVKKMISNNAQKAFARYQS